MEYFCLGIQGGICQMKCLFQTEPLKEEGIFSIPGMFVWCGSMICDLSGCHLYFSAWEQKFGFDAWVTHSRIGYAFAPTPDAAYQFRSWCLPGSGVVGAWDRDVTHNPTILESEGRYYLYYMGNFSDSGEWWDHRNHQQIGVAWSNSPSGRFSRSFRPVIEHKNAVMTSNPSVCRMPDGRFLMVYKWVAADRPSPFYGPVYHAAAFSDGPLGPFHPVKEDLFPIDGVTFPGEDPFVFVWNGKLHCLLKDNARNYSDFFRALILFDSDDGLVWKKRGAALSRNIILEEGIRRRFYRMERPQLTFCNDGIRLFCAIKPSKSSAESFSINLNIKQESFPL